MKKAKNKLKKNIYLLGSFHTNECRQKDAHSWTQDKFKKVLLVDIRTTVKWWSILLRLIQFSAVFVAEHCAADGMWLKVKAPFWVENHKLPLHCSL